jgi:hypothetical protein
MSPPLGGMVSPAAAAKYGEKTGRFEPHRIHDKPVKTLPKGVNVYMTELKWRRFQP